MTNEQLQQYRDSLQQFHEMTEKFYKEEVSVPEYKSFSGRFGSYAQRGGKLSMLRLRMTGGQVSKDHIKFIADSIEKYQISKAHLTTCQTIQLHDLTQKTVCSLIEEAFDHGIITIGGGGDYPRNVMCTPLSGVEAEESMDVLPYAKIAGDYLLGLIDEVKLPRKLKVCFSGNEKNEVHATFRDLGFVANKDNTFDVYAAGGLGNKPKLGLRVVQNLAPEKILYCIKTMVDVFVENGNYTNRGASRTRYLQDTMGKEGFVAAFNKKLQENLSLGNLDIEIPKEEKLPTFEEKAMEEERVIAQKQKGLYAVSYHPIGGVPKTEFFAKLYKSIENSDIACVKLCPDEGMYIINLTAKEVEEVLKVTEDGARNLFENSTACIGADVCQVGIGKSQVLLNACIDRVRQEDFKGDVLPAIHISGCPSSCAAHQTAILGFRGGKKRTENGSEFAFAVYENGSDEQNNEHFGNEYGSVLEKDIPELLVELGKAVSKTGLTYVAFREQHPDEVKKIIEKYI